MVVPITAPVLHCIPLPKAIPSPAPQATPLTPSKSSGPSSPRTSPPTASAPVPRHPDSHRCPQIHRGHLLYAFMRRTSAHPTPRTRLTRASRQVPMLVDVRGVCTRTTRCTARALSPRTQRRWDGRAMRAVRSRRCRRCLSWRSSCY